MAAVDVFGERRGAPTGDSSTTERGEHPDPRTWHRTMPGYEVTELVALPALAGQLGVKQVWVKNEQSRLGLPSFKILGASWAVNIALSDLRRHPPTASFAELQKSVAGRDYILTCATDGNHGRAVARLARELGLNATIYVPSTITSPRIDAIRSEGARVIVTHGTYDEAVAFVADQSARDQRYVLVSDTSWPGYEVIPSAVIAGYATIMAETQEQLESNDVPSTAPLAIFVPVGVGALAAAVSRHFRERPHLCLATVEPEGADCVAESLRRHERVELPGPHHSIMAGLNCGAPSWLAWRELEGSVDAAVVIGDDEARSAMRTFAEHGIESGESGAASLAGATAYYGAHHCGEGPGAGRTERPEGDHARVSPADTHVLLLNTEGAADSDAYALTIAGGVP